MTIEVEVTVIVSVRVKVDVTELVAAAGRKIVTSIAKETLTSTVGDGYTYVKMLRPSLLVLPTRVDPAGSAAMPLLMPFVPAIAAGATIAV